MSLYVVIIEHAFYFLISSFPRISISSSIYYFCRHLVEHAFPFLMVFEFLKSDIPVRSYGLLCSLKICDFEKYKTEKTASKVTCLQ